MSGAAPDGAGAATAGARQHMSRTIVLLCVPASRHSRDGAALPAIECRVPARDFRSPWLIGQSASTYLPSRRSTDLRIRRPTGPYIHRPIYLRQEAKMRCSRPCADWCVSAASGGRRIAGDMKGVGNAMIGSIGLYLLRLPGAVPHPKPPCEAGAAAGLVTQNVPPLLG